MTTRRTFLKLVGAAGAALGVAQYAEPFTLVPDDAPLHDWIEDKGDFYVLRVPDFKSFAREHLAKPTILLLGTKAVVRDISVDGFVNIQAPRGGLVTGSQFDASRVKVGRDRPIVEVANSDSLILSGCRLVGSGAFA